MAKVSWIKIGNIFIPAKLKLDQPFSDFRRKRLIIATIEKID